MIEKLTAVKNTNLDFPGVEEWAPNEWALMRKINEIIQAVNRLKENECGCSNCTEWRLINAQSALKGMNK